MVTANPGLGSSSGGVNVSAGGGEGGEGGEGGGGGGGGPGGPFKKNVNYSNHIQINM